MAGGTGCRNAGVTAHVTTYIKKKRNFGRLSVRTKQTCGQLLKRVYGTHQAPLKRHRTSFPPQPIIIADKLHPTHPRTPQRASSFPPYKRMASASVPLQLPPAGQHVRPPLLVAPPFLTFYKRLCPHDTHEARRWKEPFCIPTGRETHGQWKASLKLSPLFLPVLSNRR